LTRAFAVARYFFTPPHVVYRLPVPAFLVWEAQAHRLEAAAQAVRDAQVEAWRQT
jgi:hypothetical protein